MNSFRWVCVALGLAGLLSGCGPARRGVDWDGNRLQVVDIHLHPGDWNAIPEATRRFLASRFPFPIGLNAESAAQGTLSPEGILAEMDKGGVSGAVLYAVYSPRTVGIASNELVLDGLAKDPVRLRGLASLRIDKWRSATEGKDAELARLRTALAQPGMVGIKLAHAHMNFRMDDPEYFGIYEVAAALDKPVYLHTGTSPFPGTAREPPYTDPAYLEAAIRQYPKTKFILGHLGYDFENKQHAALETCIRLAKTYANVFLEPSAFGSAGSDPTRENLRIAMGRMREAGVTGRIIYGSDGPQSPGFVKDYLSRTVQAMRDTGYTEAEARAVFSENYARVFGVALPPL